jgi:FG-GAP repeat protein/VCBS repeat protein
MRDALIALVSTMLVIPSARAQSEAWRAHGVSTIGIGNSVAWLSDLNSDGVADFAAGGASLTSQPGSGQVLIGSGADGSTLFDLVGEPGAGFGIAVARAGDVDGDGLDDFAVGAPFNGNGAVYIYSGATGAMLRTLSGPSAGSLFGQSIADVGDVDGDGIRDLAIGAPEDTSSGSRLGLAEIVSGATGNVIKQWTGAAVDGQFGSVVADAGDVDRDGLEDVLVVVQNDSGKGKLKLYSSATSLLLRGLDLGSFKSDWTANGAGDVNGDGIPDVIVGNPSWPSTFISPNWYLGGVWVYDGATGSLIRSHPSFPTYHKVGSSVSAAGDVDGDGFADYAFTWMAQPMGGPVPDNVTIFSGATGAAIATANTTGVSGGAHDTNGDGVPDLLLTYSNSVFGIFGGVARVFDPVSQTFLTSSPGTYRADLLGRASALLDDVDGDGTRDVLVGEGGKDFLPFPGSARILSGLDGSELRVHSDAASGYLYARCVAALPDVDGDGIGEYAITVADAWTIPGFVEIRSGATGNLLNSFSTGSNDNGSFGSSCAVAIQPSGAVELAVGCPYHAPVGEVVVFDVLTGNTVVTASSGSLGLSVTFLGDVDGDGVGDWAAGATDAVLVISGQSGSTLQTLQGSRLSGFGKSTCGPGDLDGDGTPDLLVGAPSLGQVDLFSGATWTQVRSWSGYGLGSSLTVVGDVNGDGFNDVLFGQNLGGDVGAVHLYSGGSGGRLYRFDGAMKGDYFGETIAGVGAPGSNGSMNGDTIPDVVIGGEYDSTNGTDAGRLSLHFLDDLYLQIDPPSASAGKTVTLATSGGPVGNLAVLVIVDLDSTPLFLPVSYGNLDTQGIWSFSSVVPPGIGGHTFTFESMTIGFTGKLAITQPMSLTLQ